jgi:hypothetical protein
LKVRWLLQGPNLLVLAFLSKPFQNKASTANGLASDAAAAQLSAGKCIQ